MCIYLLKHKINCFFCGMYKHILNIIFILDRSFESTSSDSSLSNIEILKKKIYKKNAKKKQTCKCTFSFCFMSLVVIKM